MEILHQSIPELNIIDQDPETLSLNIKKLWPIEFNNVCETLYEKYMGSLPNLVADENQTFITQGVFDNFQSKYFIIMSFWGS